MRFQAIVRGIRSLFGGRKTENKGKLHVPAVKTTAALPALGSLLGAKKDKSTKPSRLGRKRNWREHRESRNRMASASRRKNAGR